MARLDRLGQRSRSGKGNAARLVIVLALFIILFVSSGPLRQLYWGMSSRLSVAVNPAPRGTTIVDRGQADTLPALTHSAVDVSLDTHPCRPFEFGYCLRGAQG